ncbi:hypothetical protein M1105_14165 [Limibaculum sp. FT325]|uniref:hypothetical protein n=1 Tax=Thermohalobaculum sediminis TaxID=2939436 RepID=UPI0020BF267D|nr:hypothetical protein [Limibaculum sediminis]MCL5778126.1 hypothetical protein [Limibaculum sediminis]
MTIERFIPGLTGILMAGTAAVALSLTAPGDTAFAAGGQGAGGQQKGQGGAHGKGGAGAGEGRGGGLGGIFRDITGAEEEDSDRPDWAGEKGGKAGAGGKPTTAGSKRGDLFGDLWVILRDEDGVPILTPEGFVQPIDAEGNLIPLDEEGAPIEETLTQEVELGRLNVGRAPTKVLDRRADEVILLLESATALALDPSGRLTVTTLVDGVETTKTIDSPLENLAIYVALMTTGSIPDMTPDDLVGTEFDFMVDGALTIEDLQAAPAFLAAATDKTSPFSVDEIAYIDAFLDIQTVTVGSVTYTDIDYSSFSYDRSDTFGDATATVLIQQTDGSWEATEVNIYETVFASTDLTASGTLEAFTAAAEDARQVLEYIHEYAVPIDQLAAN